MSHPDLPRVLADAALQSRFMRPHRNDLVRASRGMKFVHGVDASVIRDWGNPLSNTEKQRHVGQIFSGDPPPLATAIALGLLSHVFNDIGAGKPPLLILPPIEYEVSAILTALQNQDLRSSSPSMRTEVASIVSEIQDRISPERLGSLNVKLHEVIFNEIGPQHVLRRILILFAQGRITKLEEARSKLDPELRKILLPQHGLLRQWSKYAQAKHGYGGRPGWFSRLRDVNPGRKTKLSSHDAEVLSRLEVWNKELRERESVWRILYITTDLSLFRAAATVDASWDVKGTSFAEAFLRHPRAYLAEEGVLGTVDAARNSSLADGPSDTVGDWLALLTDPAQARFADLLDATRNAVPAPESVSAYARRLSEQSGAGGEAAEQLAVKLLQKWDRFAKGALAARGRPKEAFLGLTRDFQRSADQMFDILAEAHTRLEDSRAETLEQYLGVATRLGRRVESGRRKRGLLWSVAPIFFEAWEEANRAIAMMSRWSDTAVDETAYRNATDLIGHDDPSSYAFYLGHSAFFAACGRWSSAALLARRARHVRDDRGANGREAAYFECFCRRRMARELTDLAEARECLDEARDILRKEISEGKYVEFVEERFLVEAALLDFSALLFSFDGGEEWQSRSAKSGKAERVCATLWDLLTQEWILMGIDKDPLNYRVPEPPVTGAADAADTRLRTEVHLLVTAIMSAFLPVSIPEANEHARFALSVLERRLSDGVIAEATLSIFDKAYLYAARLREQASDTLPIQRRHFEGVTSAIDDDTGMLSPQEIRLLETLKLKSTIDWEGRRVGSKL